MKNKFKEYGGVLLLIMFLMLIVKCVILFFHSLFSRLSMISCSGDILGAWFTQLYTFLFVLSYLILESYYFFKKRPDKKILYIFLFGLNILVLTPLLVVSGGNTMMYKYYYPTFDSGVWNSAHEKPLPMVRTILRDNDFIGKNLNFVQNLLGDDFTYETDYDSTKYFSYNLDDSFYWELQFYYKDSIVTDVEIYCND